MHKSIECILTGFKGDFESIARHRKTTIHGKEIYTIESLCKAVSITVYASLVHHKLEQCAKPEFYYS